MEGDYEIRECIKILEIDVRINDVNYKDRIEWDILDKNSVPEVNIMYHK